MTQRLVPLKSVPTIDISPLFKDDSEGKLRIAEQIRKVCQEDSGFFIINNHSIPNEKLDQLMHYSNQFFSLPVASKSKLSPKKWNPENSNIYRGYFPANVNGKEGIDFGNPSFTEDTYRNQFNGHYLGEVTYWPELPEFNEFMKSYYTDMISVAKKLLEVFEIAIGAPNNYLQDKLNESDSLSTLRLNYYPEPKSPDEQIPVRVLADGTKLSCEIHTDGAVLTILYQPAVGGLQVETPSGEWIEIPPTPYEFVVNTGLCMQRISNDRFRAANHRVRKIDQERLSVPFFVELGIQTAFESFPSADQELMYPPTTYGDYIMDSNKRFVEYQR